MTSNNNLNGYIAMFKDKKIKVYATTTLEAQEKAHAIFKNKKSYDISVFLVEKNGEQVLTNTNTL